MSKKALWIFSVIGPARADADLDAVEFADRRHFGGRAGEEGLVGDVDLVARDALLHHLDAQVLADVQDGVARDAVERAGRQVGRVDHAALDHEDVLARAFGDEAAGVEQQRLVVAVVQRLHVGQDRVGVVAHRLGLRHRDVDVVARVARGLDADAALHAFVAEVGAPGPGRDHGVDAVALGADAELLGADPHQRAQVAALQLVLAHHLLLRLVELLGRERDLHAQDLGAVEQALGVLGQAEDRRAVGGLVGAHALESAAAVVQRVAQHVDLGVAPVHELAVHPDLAVTIVQCGGARSCSLSFGEGVCRKSLRFYGGDRLRPADNARLCQSVSQKRVRFSVRLQERHRLPHRSIVVAVARPGRAGPRPAALRPLRPLAGKIRRLGRAPRRGTRPAGRIHRRPVAARIHDREQGAAGFGGAPQGRGARRADRGHHRPQAGQEGKEGAEGRRHARAAAAGLHAPCAHRGLDRPGRAAAGGQCEQRGSAPTRW